MSKLGFFPDTWMGRGVCTSGSAPLTDTFLMARRHTVWPILNTAETGTWAWSGDSGKMFGGCYTNTSNTANDSISFDNLNLFSAGAAINLLYTKASTGGVAKIYWGTKGEAGDLLGTIDMYAASTQKNQVAQFSLGTVTKARKTLHVVMETAGTGGGYTCQIQQAEVVQLTGSNLGTSIDDLPWWVDVPPFAYSAASTTVLLNVSTNYVTGSEIYLLDGLQNGYLEAQVGLHHGTYTLNMLGRTFSNRAIVTAAIGGSTVGTMDFYAASGSYNAKKSISGISVSESGTETLRITAATKHASSSGYYMTPNWLQFRKTAAHGAITPTGATYGRESAELWPWFADTKVGFDSFLLGSGVLHYGGFWNSGRAINDSMEWAQSCKSGTYAVLEVGRSAANDAIVHLSNGGGDLDTVDHYSGSTVYNNRFSMSGSLAAGPLKLAADSKNASSADYTVIDTMTRLTRTGA